MMKDRMTVEKKRTMNNVELFDIGFDSLVSALGLIDAERFISMVKEDDFDYTKWRRSYFGDRDIESLCDEAVAYAKAHPHEGKGRRI